MSNQKLNRDFIIQHIGSKRILDRYLEPYHNHGALRHGQLISSPFARPRIQNTPSFNIYETPGGKWRYNDFSFGFGGDCIDLVVRLFNLSFLEALEKIHRDFGVDPEPFGVAMPKPVPGPKPIKHIEKLPEDFVSNLPAYPKGVIYIQVDLDTELVVRPFTDREIYYWLDYGILLILLAAYKVFAVEKYTTVNKIGRSYTIFSKEENPIFAYQIGPRAFKLYRPMDRKFRFAYLGKKPKPYCFGWNQLPRTGDAVIITGGEKDVLSFRSTGCNAISFNSETAIPSESIINDLKKRFKNVLVCYDNDPTGHKASEKLCDLFNLQILNIYPNAAA